MKLFGVEVGKKRTPRTTAKVLTQKQLQNGLMIAGLKQLTQDFEDNPDLAREFIRQKLHFKMPDYGEQLLQQAIADDPDLKKQYIQKMLDRKGIEGMSDREKFISDMEFYGNILGLRGNSSGGLGSLLNAETITAVMAALPMLIQMANGQPVTANHQLHNGHDRPALTSGKETEDMPETEIDLVDDYVDELFTMMTKSAVSPEECAKWALQQINHLVIELRKAGHDTSKAEQIYSVLTQPAQVMVIILNSAAAMSGRSEYVEAVNQLRTPDGQKYLTRFCEARDQFLASMQV